MAAAIPIIFCVVLVAVTLIGRLPWEFFYLYCAASCIAFILYAIDKSAAKRGRRRTPEKRLHFFSMIGGWPGAYLAQRIFRHKTQKLSFRRIYWLTVAINICVFTWLCTNHGRQWFSMLIG